MPASASSGAASLGGHVEAAEGPEDGSGAGAQGTRCRLNWQAASGNSWSGACSDRRPA